MKSTFHPGLKMCSKVENQGLEESQEEQIPRPPKSLLGVRHIQATLYFFLIWIAYAMRVNLSVGIVAMTDNTTTSNPDIKTYNWDDKSIVLSSFYWGYIGPQVFAGHLSRFYGPKWFLVGSMLINSAACMAIPVVADNLGSGGVMGCRIVQGLSQGIIFPSLHNLLGKWAPTPERSRIGTFVFSGMPFGTIVAMPITALISASWAGWPVSFYVFGSLGLFWIVAWVLLGANSPEEHKSISEEERNYIVASLGPKEVEKRPTPWGDFAVSLPLWAVVAGNVGYNWGQSTLLTEIPNYLNKIMDFDMQTNGFLSAAPYLAFWILSFIAGPIADYMINSGIMPRGGVRKLFNTIGNCVPAAALIWLGFVPDDQVALSMALLVVAVAINVACFCGFIVNHIDLSPNHAGVLMGITNCIATIFSILAPLVVHAVVYDETDKSLWRIIFIAAAAIYVATAIFYIIFASGDVQYWNGEAESSQEKKEKRKKKTMSSAE